MTIADVAVTDTNTEGPTSSAAPPIERSARPPTTCLVASCARLGVAVRLSKARQGAERLSRHAGLTVIGRHTATPSIQAGRFAYGGARP